MPRGLDHLVIAASKLAPALCLLSLQPIAVHSGGAELIAERDTPSGPVTLHALAC